MAIGVKDEAKALIDRLPDTTSWDEVADLMILRQKIARGLADGAAGRVHSTAEMRRRFGLDE